MRVFQKSAPATLTEADGLFLGGKRSAPVTPSTLAPSSHPPSALPTPAASPAGSGIYSSAEKASLSAEGLVQWRANAQEGGSLLAKACSALDEDEGEGNTTAVIRPADFSAPSAEWLSGNGPTNLDFMASLTLDDSMPPQLINLVSNLATPRIGIASPLAVPNPCLASASSVQARPRAPRPLGQVSPATRVIAEAALLRRQHGCHVSVPNARAAARVLAEGTNSAAVLRRAVQVVGVGGEPAAWQALARTADAHDDATNAVRAALYRTAAEAGAACLPGDQVGSLVNTALQVWSWVRRGPSDVPLIASGVGGAAAVALLEKALKKFGSANLAFLEKEFILGSARELHGMKAAERLLAAWGPEESSGTVVKVLNATDLSPGTFSRCVYLGDPHAVHLPLPKAAACGDPGGQEVAYGPSMRPVNRRVSRTRLVLVDDLSLPMLTEVVGMNPLMQQHRTQQVATTSAASSLRHHQLLVRPPAGANMVTPVVSPFKLRSMQLQSQLTWVGSKPNPILQLRRPTFFPPAKSALASWTGFLAAERRGAQTSRLQLLTRQRNPMALSCLAALPVTPSGSEQYLMCDILGASPSQEDADSMNAEPHPIYEVQSGSCRADAPSVFPALAPRAEGIVVDQARWPASLLLEAIGHDVYTSTSLDAEIC